MSRRFVLGTLVVSAAFAAGAIPAVAESKKEATGQATRRDCQDLFVVGTPGDASSTGRFVLTWRGLLPGDEEVRLDGVPQQYGRDYDLDFERGVIRFKRPPAPGAVVQVAYRLLPLNATRNGPMGRDALDATEPAPIRPQLRAVGRGPVARYLSLDRGPEVPVADDVEPGRVSVRIDGEKRVPSPTSGQLRDQLLSGLRQTELQQRVDEAGLGSATVSYLRADALDPRTAQDAREEFRSSLDLRPDAASRLQFSNYLSRESIFSEDYEEIERRQLQFEKTWGQSTVGLLWNRQRRDGFGMANALDALSLTLSHPFNRHLSAEGLFSFENSLYRGQETSGLFTLRERFNRWLSGQASVQHRDSAFSGATLETGVTLSARPGNNAEAEFAFQEAYSERYGRYQRLASEINAAITERVMLLGEVSRRYTRDLGTVHSFGLGFSARPTAGMLLDAAFSESLGDVIGRERSRTLRFSMDPSAALRIQLGYDLLANSDHGRSENGLWMVTVGGRRYVKLEGYRGVREFSGEDPIEDALYRLEVRPLDALALSGSLRRIGDDDDLRSLASVGASLRLVQGVEVTATYRRPTESDEANPEISGRDLRLTLAPVSGFRLFGEHSTRPEDERGALLDQVNRTLGVETHLGSFGLQGSLTSIQGSLLEEPGRQTDFLASLNLSSGTRLYGGLRTLDVLGPEQLRSEILRLGISQTAGPSLFLLLEGQLGYIRDPVGGRVYNPDDTRAQARLGFRF